MEYFMTKTLRRHLKNVVRIPQPEDLFLSLYKFNFFYNTKKKKWEELLFADYDSVN